MKKAVLFVALVAMGLLVVGSSSALAQGTNATAAFAKVVNGLHNGDSYRKPSGSLTAGVVSIPSTVDSSADFASTAGTVVQAGPMSVGGSDLMVSRGSALVGPSGGAVYSPQQRAAMDIRRLIRALD